ncbi:MAG: hypothetical protein JW812_02755, partial [Alphaproteobacteria bacterium]|nr:hypothetical protein [Alphaproteobacteria bacterium]
KYVNYSWSEPVCKKFKPGTKGKCIPQNFGVINTGLHSIRATSCTTANGEALAREADGSYVVPGGEEREASTTTRSN